MRSRRLLRSIALTAICVASVTLAFTLSPALASKTHVARRAQIGTNLLTNAAFAASTPFTFKQGSGCNLNPGNDIPYSYAQWSAYSLDTTGTASITPGYGETNDTATSGDCTAVALYQDMYAPPAPSSNTGTFEASTEFYVNSGTGPQSMEVFFGLNHLDHGSLANGSDRVTISPAGTLTLASNKSVATPVTVTLSPQTWNEVAMCVTPKSTSLYYNGALETTVATGAVGTSLPTTTTTFGLGQTSGNNGGDSSDFDWTNTFLATGTCADVQPSVPSIIFTYNGRQDSAPIPAPLQANDFDVTWKPGRCVAGYELPPVVAVFTYQGRYVSGDPPLAPCANQKPASDVEIFWAPNLNVQPETNVITKACWTSAKGICVGAIKPPVGGLVSNDPTGATKAPYIDDVCFELSYGKRGIVSAYWTVKGKRLGHPIAVPPRANDVCWYGYPES